MKIFCYQCRRQTNHKTIAHEIISHREPGDEFFDEHHYFSRCAGCEAITYAIEISGENYYDPYTGERYSVWKTYPQSSTDRELFEGIIQLPAKVQTIYKEVIGAMNAQLPVLAGIGLRGLIEAICKDQNVTGSSLEKRIDALASKGVLSSAQAEILHTHRFLGNVAAHEVVSAKPYELIAALEIAETVMKTIYIIPGLSKLVKTGKELDA